MKKVIALMTAASIGLGGCASTGGLPTIDPVQVANVEAEIQKDAAAICGFVPTLAAVAGVVATFVSGQAIVGLVDQAANAICTAVTSVPTVKAQGSRRRMLAGPVTVNGVPIHGYFLTK